MAKRVFLIHGWEGYPEEGWRPWLKKKLGAEAIVMHNMKHFSGDDGINELPIALGSVLKLAEG